MPWGAILPPGISVLLTDFRFLLQCLGLWLRALLVDLYSHHRSPEALVLMAQGERSAFSLQTLAGGQQGQPQAQEK